VYATRLPRIEDHLARYRLADIFLDTYPYNGHTTVSDALFSGLPVVTIAGKSFASRVASSLLYDVGLSEYSCKSVEEYHSKILKLSCSPDELQKIRLHLQQIKMTGIWPPNEKSQYTAIATAINSMSI